MAQSALLPHVEYLCACFFYDRDTGELTWKVRPSEHFLSQCAWTRCNNMFAGTVAGWINDKGHRCISIDGRSYKAHRIVWKLVTGEEPPPEIDHKDGDYANNRWGNLRAATDGEQRWNSRSLNTNTTGKRGVIWNKKLRKWQAAICAKGMRRHLGLFRSIDDASAAYETAARQLQGEFYRQPQEMRS